jgi:hypothetical protein
VIIIRLAQAGMRKPNIPIPQRQPIPFDELTESVTNAATQGITRNGQNSRPMARASHRTVVISATTMSLGRLTPDWPMLWKMEPGAYWSNDLAVDMMMYEMRYNEMAKVYVCPRPIKLVSLANGGFARAKAIVPAVVRVPSRDSELNSEKA